MMTHYEERLEQDLKTIRSRVKEVAARVGKALKDAVQAVINGDRVLANSVILGDLPINREIREIDRLTHAFVARHLPSAGHLRYVSSVLRLNIELERIGDYAVAIAREAIQLAAPPTGSVLRDIELIGDQSHRIFTQAMKAFDEGNADLARGTKGMAGQVNSTFQRILSDLHHEGEKQTRPIKDLFALLVIINRLGRVSDQAKNICEETVFAATGETKGEKTYPILFIDEKNDSLSLMAELHARKIFPESGQYSSAGWSPASHLDPRFELFMDSHGYDLRDLEPQLLDASVESLNEYFAVVSLQAGAHEHIRELPFHTLLLEWDVGEIPDGLDQERNEALLEEAHKRVSLEVQELMETLRGQKAR
ncbi:MAG: phosphate signaling complex protein PhoU [Thermoanaerobaculia bacterium]